jgi:hypothetical protein
MSSVAGWNTGTVATASRSHTSLDQLMDEIKFQRRKELRSFSQDPGFTIAHNTTYWTDLFVRHFLFQTDTAIDRDDLLFFVRKRLAVTSQFLSPRYDSEVEVFRRDSRKLPIGDPDVDWEETIYLNLVIHLFEYKITLAICTRTSPTNLQVLKRSTQRVWASPSHRRMDSKSEGEEMTYPYVCFTVDNFEEAFSDIEVRDGEMVSVELVAIDNKRAIESVLFLGCVQYDSVRRVYDARTSQTVGQRLSQTNLLSMFGSGKERVEHVHVKGPNEKGHVELAISKPKGAGCDTPSSEPGFSLTDQLLDSESEDEGGSSWLGDGGGSMATSTGGFQKGHHRRLSDPSYSLDTWLRGGWKSRPGHRSQSESEGLDSWMSNTIEIEAGDLRDNLDDGATNPLWTMKGYTQVYHGWKEHKKAQSTPLKTHLTYLTLPWWTIIRDILDSKDVPLLTF